MNILNMVSPNKGNDEKPADTARRDFLRKGAAAATITLAPGVTLMTWGSEASAKATSDKRWGMLTDISKCKSDCSACISACSTENGWKDTGHPETDAQSCWLTSTSASAAAIA